MKEESFSTVSESATRRSPFLMNFDEQNRHSYSGRTRALRWRGTARRAPTKAAYRTELGCQNSLEGVRARSVLCGRSLSLSLMLLCFVLAAPQLVSSDSFPTPPEPGVMYGVHGQSLHVYTTPNGRVGYDEKGQRFEEFKTPGGSSMWYSDQGKLFGAPPLLAPVAPPSFLRPGAF